MNCCQHVEPQKHLFNAGGNVNDTGNLEDNLMASYKAEPHFNI